MLREFIERATAAFKRPTDPMLLDFSYGNRKPAYLKTDGKLSKQDIDRLLNSTGGIRVGNTSFIYNEENLKDTGKPKPTKKSRSDDLYDKLLREMHETYLKKNADYGNSFEESLDKHGALAAVIQMEHKMNRLNNLVSNEDNQRVVDESIVDTVMDLANYAVMTGVWLVKQREGEAKFYADNQEYKMSGADFDGDTVYPTNQERYLQYNAEGISIRPGAKEMGHIQLNNLELDMLGGSIDRDTYRERVAYVKKTYGID